jgi:hypothetical protein
VIPKTAMFLPLGVGLLAAGLCGQARAQATTAGSQLVPHLGMNAAYVREARDQAWHIRITDKMPTSPGGYVIVYNERGDIVHHGEIPKGDYSAESPFVLTVPADGAAQQYVIKLLGVPATLGAITLPVSDLPFEVYDGVEHHGSKLFSMPGAGRGEIVRYAFQVKPGVAKMTLVAAGPMRILGPDGAVLAETTPAPTTAPKGQKVAPADVPLDLKALAGQIYWLDPLKSWKVETPKDSEKLYLTLDPAKWFSPTITWDLDSRPWWKGLFKP